jgi:hypothetical protein
LLDTWKHGVEENVDQKVGLKVARTFQLIKSGDFITKNIKHKARHYVKSNLQRVMLLRHSSCDH